MKWPVSHTQENQSQLFRSAANSDFSLKWKEIKPLSEEPAALSVSVGFALRLTKLKNGVGFQYFPPLSFECFTHVSTQSCFPWSSERCYSISTQCQFTISGLRNFFPTGFTPLIPWIKCFTNTPQRHEQTQLGREHDASWIFSLHTALDCTHTTTVYWTT